MKNVSTRLLFVSESLFLCKCNKPYLPFDSIAYSYSYSFHSNLTIFPNECAPPLGRTRSRQRPYKSRTCNLHTTGSSINSGEGIDIVLRHQVDEGTWATRLLEFHHDGEWAAKVSLVRPEICLYRFLRESGHHLALCQPSASAEIGADKYHWSDQHSGATLPGTPSK